MKIDTVENLRQYIPELRPGKRNKVHEAIAETIRDNPDEFIVLNSGFTVCAAECVVNEEKKEIRLRNSSLVNGAQSQGEIKRYLTECDEKGEPAKEFYVRAEIVVIDEPDFVTEVAIARNTATKVSELAQAGKKRKFDDVEASFIKVFPDAKLRKSDTDPIDTVDTERVIQLCAALMPPELVGEDKLISSKLKAYKNKAQCRVDFEKAYDESVKVDKGDQDATLVECYGFYVDMAPVAWKAYQEYRTHPAWKGKRLRKDTKAVKRKPNQAITIADGLVFPMVSALSLFVKKRNGRWELVRPPVFRDEMLIEAAVEQFREACNSDPVVMGRSAGAYQSLMFVSRMSLLMEANK